MTCEMTLPAAIESTDEVFVFPLSTALLLFVVPEQEKAKRKIRAGRAFLTFIINTKIVFL